LTQILDFTDDRAPWGPWSPRQARPPATIAMRM